MTDIKEKQLAVLNDTINHYTSQNRCIGNKGRCQYSPTQTSKGCAIGRLIEDQEIVKNLDHFNNSVDNNHVFILLPNNLKELGQDFLTELQDLHDNSYYWDKDGLSDEGKNFVNLIKHKFGFIN